MTVAEIRPGAWQPDPADVAAWLDAVYGPGDVVGDVMLATLTNGQWIESGGKHRYKGIWRENADRKAWPAQRDELIAVLAKPSAVRIDYYARPYLTPPGATRAKGNAVVRRLVHVDRDGDTPIVLPPIPGLFAIDSGTPDHEHVYVRVADDLDEATHERLCRMLRSVIGSADAKVSDNDVLRPVGTLNHKTSAERPGYWSAGAARPVTWLKRPDPTVRPLTGEQLAGVLRALGAPEPGERAASTPAGPVDLPEPVRAALGGLTGDRSDDTQRLVYAAAAAGMGRTETFDVVRSVPSLAERLREKGRGAQKDLERCWDNALGWLADRDTVIDEMSRAITVSGLPAPRRGEAATPGSTATPGAESADGETDDEDLMATAVAREVARLRIAERAKRVVVEEQARVAWREPPAWPDLADALRVDDPPVRYRLDGLLPAGGNVVLAAEFKAGKTTTVNALARSLADGVPFLGRFAVTPPAGRVALWNYEVGEAQYRRWLRQVGIAHPERVAVLNLRGFRAPLTVPFVEAWAIDWLKRHEVAFWIVDPFARAYSGCGDENDNSAVGVFLETLDVIKERAGVEELVMPAHTGRQDFDAGRERVRGATRLDDWPDVRWLLARDPVTGARFFRASGRDVEVPEESLTYDRETRSLVFGGSDRTALQAERENKTADRIRDEILNSVKANPGISVREIRDSIRGKSTTVGGIVEELVEDGSIERRKVGAKHYLYPSGALAAAIGDSALIGEG